MKRVARYLVGKPRLVWMYKWQPETELIEVFADANFAGCKLTRKSTSGGALMLGGHCIKTWPKSQACVTLSSAESELLGAVKGGVEGLGMHSLMGDFGIKAKLCLHMDASAAIGVMQRRGVGKISHLDVSSLWLQEKQLKQLMEVRKVNGLANAGDLMTKNVPYEVIKKYLASISCEWRDGRAQIAAQLHRIGARGEQEYKDDGVSSRGQPRMGHRGQPPRDKGEQDSRIVIATRSTDDKMRHFISLPKSMKDAWPEVQWRRTSDRDSGEMLCDEHVGGLHHAVLYRRLDKPRMLLV